MVAVTIAVLVGLMLAEQRVSLRHEAWLRQQNAVLPPGDVFMALTVLYPAAFLVMGIEGVWRAMTASGPVDPGAPAWAVSGGLLFIASKWLKYAAIRALGPRWSFRVYVLPGRPLVMSGPYRYLRHPNYVAVIGELVSTAMMVGAVISGPVMLVAFGVVLWARIRFEERALITMAGPPKGS
jgi:methyltransferase